MTIKLSHIGICVSDMERSVRFYAVLGFTKTAGPVGPEPVRPSYALRTDVRNISSQSAIR